MSFKDKIRYAVRDGGVVDKALIWGFVATGLLALVDGELMLALYSLLVVLLIRRVGLLAKRLRDAGVEP